jgi:hypothetical protein
MNPEEFSESDVSAASEGDSFRYEAVGPGHKDFRPWHQPRKQYVRSEQWAVAIEALLAVAPISDRPLKYIGLPGDDLLDIRFFADRICSARNLQFLYLGLNQNIDSKSASRTRVDSAIFDIRTKYPLVCKASDVVSDSFDNLAVPKSLVFKKCDELGFFDIVNLDLCDGLAKNKPGAAEPTNYSAIQHLLGRQFKSRSSWLLFLTTRVGAQHCEAETRAKLRSLIDVNREKCGGFAAALDQFCGGLMDAASDEVQIMAINMFGILKWLGQMCVAESGWRMETLAIDCYTVHRGSPTEDLFSVAVQFVSVGTVAADPVGLGAAVPSKDDECRIALDIASKLNQRRNVDVLLEQDADAYERAVMENCRLLKDAGYDIESYKRQLSEVWKLPIAGIALPT